MIRKSTRPPGSTLMISGSAGVRKKIGEEGVVFDVVEVGPRRGRHHRRRRLHTRHRGHGAGRLRHARHRARLLQILKDLFCRREAEIGQHHHDLLLVRPVAFVVDDEQRRHQALLLQPLMRVHPERAAKAQREVVIR